MRTAVVSSIFGGTNEVQREIVSKTLGGCSPVILRRRPEHDALELGDRPRRGASRLEALGADLAGVERVAQLAELGAGTSATRRVRPRAG